MKPQDILVALKIISLKGEPWTQAALAASLLISPSEVSSVFERLKESGFINQTKNNINTQAFREFLIHGLKYVFPPKLGTKVRGIATAHSASPIKEFISEGEDILVWKSANGNRRGLSVDPLYKTVPKIITTDSSLYELLVIVDTLRIGRVREIEVAINELDKRLEYVS
ncbi:MAG: hypothetical protein ACK5NK_06465 [Niabella sp.]